MLLRGLTSDRAVSVYPVKFGVMQGLTFIEFEEKTERKK